MKQTAMQDLRSSLANLNHDVNNPAYELINTIIKGIDTVYLAMERQQIEQAYTQSTIDSIDGFTGDMMSFENSEDYYNKTYGHVQSTDAIDTELTD